MSWIAFSNGYLLARRYVPQPLGFKIDLEMPEDELYRETEANCRARDGFKPIEEWRADISKKIAAQLDAAG